jgi:hypothetical protein
MTKKNGARRGRDYWTEVIAKFERRGLSRDAFCERESLNISTFRWWLYRIRGEVRVDAPSFVEVVDRPSLPVARCVLRLGSAEVAFDRAPTANYLAELLTALESGGQ